MLAAQSALTYIYALPLSIMISWLLSGGGNASLGT